MRIETIVRAIQEAVDSATKKGVDVTVKITENGFFPSERTVIEITAKKSPCTPAR